MLTRHQNRRHPQLGKAERGQDDMRVSSEEIEYTMLASRRAIERKVVKDEDKLVHPRNEEVK